MKQSEQTQKQEDSMGGRGVPRRVPVANRYSDNSESETRTRRGYPGFSDEIKRGQRVLGNPGYSDNPGTRTARFRLRSSRGITNGRQCILRFDVETRTITIKQQRSIQKYEIRKYSRN